jgi:hypothetical protein
MVQWIIVGIIVVVAAVYLVRRLWRSSSPEGCTGCPNCAECPSFPLADEACPHPPNDRAH